ncbi:hypothetical protein Tco_1411170 [Tanacetum coccineum]
MGDENLIRTLGDYSKPSYEGYRNTIELPAGNNVVPLRSDTIRRTIHQSAGGKLYDLNPEESWAILEDLALYDNKSWNYPRDFAKPVKAINLPQDVPSTSDRRLIELENHVQRLMEAYFTSTQLTQVNKITVVPTTPQYCMQDPDKPFDTKEEDDSSTNAYDLNLDGMVKGKEEVNEKGKEEDEMETNMEVEKVIEEEESEFKTDEKVEEISEEEEEDEDDENFNLFSTIKELSHHEWLLKNP